MVASVRPWNDPLKVMIRDVHPQSVGKGRVSRLSPEVDALCADLLARLDHLNEAALRAPSPAISPTR